MKGGRYTPRPSKKRRLEYGSYNRFQPPVDDFVEDDSGSDTEPYLFPDDGDEGDEGDDDDVASESSIDLPIRSSNPQRGGMARVVRECVKCAGITKSGNECTRQTCKYSKYCWQHTKQISGLKLAPSKIANAGDGLFTTREFKRGHKITNYGGVEYTLEDWKKLSGSYGAKFRGKILDARSTQSDGLGRWANDCRGDTVGCTKNNATWSTFNGNNKKGLPPKLSLRAKVNIPIGDEVYVSYGKAYWQRKPRIKGGVPRNKIAVNPQLVRPPLKNNEAVKSSWRPRRERRSVRRERRNVRRSAMEESGSDDVPIRNDDFMNPEFWGILFGEVDIIPSARKRYMARIRRVQNRKDLDPDDRYEQLKTLRDEVIRN